MINSIMDIFYLGDIHRNFSNLDSYIRRIKISDCYIIQVGDFGIDTKGVDKNKVALKSLNRTLYNRNIHLYAIRGNHDYKKEFDTQEINLSNIKLVPDYTVLRIMGNNILCIGGAISIDRELTKTNLQKKGIYKIIGKEKWFPNEEFSLGLDKLEKMRNIDIVVTHTAPNYCPPDNSNGFNYLVDSMSMDDKNLKTDLLYERNLLTRAFDVLKKNNDIKYHYYGHFHSSNYVDIECNKQDYKTTKTRHRLLGISELWLEK